MDNFSIATFYMMVPSAITSFPGAIAGKPATITSQTAVITASGTTDNPTAGTKTTRPAATSSRTEKKEAPPKRAASFFK